MLRVAKPTPAINQGCNGAVRISSNPLSTFTIGKHHTHVATSNRSVLVQARFQSTSILRQRISCSHTTIISSKVSGRSFSKTTIFRDEDALPFGNGRTSTASLLVDARRARETQRRKILKLEEQLDIRSWEDWYNVTKEQIQAHGGGALLQAHYQNSPARMLEAIYPEHPWQSEKFTASRSVATVEGDAATEGQELDPQSPQAKTIEWRKRQAALKKKNRKTGRSGVPDHQILVPPKWFAEQLPPNVYIDGELWAGYGNLPKIKAQLASGKPLGDDFWRQIKFVCFDSPDHKIRDKPYMERHALIKQALDEQAERLRQQRLEQQQQQQQQLPAGEESKSTTEVATTTESSQPLTPEQQDAAQKHQLIVTASTKLSELQPNVMLIHAEKCTGREHMRLFFQDVIARGGEGIVLRDSTAPYLPGYQMWQKKECLFGTAKIVAVEDNDVKIHNEFDMEFPLNTLPPPEVRAQLRQHLDNSGGDTIITYGYYGLTADTKPMAPFFKKLHAHIKGWDDISPYQVEHQTLASRCAVCRSRIPLAKLCVKVKGIYFSNHSRGVGRVIRVSYCIDTNCLQSIDDFQEMKSKYRVPKFNNKLAIPQAAQNWTQEQLRQFEDLKERTKSWITFVPSLVVEDKGSNKQEKAEENGEETSQETSELETVIENEGYSFPPQVAAILNGSSVAAVMGEASIEK